jgi:hypothetical protein
MICLYSLSFDQNVESPILQATQAHVSIEKMESKVLQIMAMGFERQNVMKAMQAAFMNPDRAVEYLLTGMKEKTTLTVSAPTGFSQPSALLQYTMGPSNARAGPLALTCVSARKNYSFLSCEGCPVRRLWCAGAGHSCGLCFVRTLRHYRTIATIFISHDLSKTTFSNIPIRTLQ